MVCCLLVFWFAPIHYPAIYLFGRVPVRGFSLAWAAVLLCCYSLDGKAHRQWVCSRGLQPVLCSLCVEGSLDSPSVISALSEHCMKGMPLLSLAGNTSQHRIKILKSGEVVCAPYDDSLCVVWEVCMLGSCRCSYLKLFFMERLDDTPGTHSVLGKDFYHLRSTRPSAPMSTWQTLMWQGLCKVVTILSTFFLCWKGCTACKCSSDEKAWRCAPPQAAGVPRRTVSVNCLSWPHSKRCSQEETVIFAACYKWTVILIMVNVTVPSGLCFLPN